MNSTYIKAQLFLVVAIVAAIAFVGCIYELSSGAPDWGAQITWSILVGSLPVSIGCFVVAVKLAKASMENNP
ncbi:MAG: hypothetical protein RMK91_06185 [Pseudanabaenaceae cyanobacterium SKYGB_i_bin29]|nr:hypothetical protein [Pseudanabaenaceae cyanobacterium SKYG29]MDW8421441.1 hypothetical protein [Pseudanabaenaceae cyanobacterium SKYGB_i_bin29]